MSSCYASVAAATFQAAKNLASAANFEAAVNKVLSTMSLKDEINSIIQSSTKDKPREILLAIACSASNCLDYLEDDTTMVEDIENWLFAEALGDVPMES